MFAIERLELVALVVTPCLMAVRSGALMVWWASIIMIMDAWSIFRWIVVLRTMIIVGTAMSGVWFIVPELLVMVRKVMRLVMWMWIWIAVGAC